MTLAQTRFSYDYPERLPVAVVGAGDHCARHILPCLRHLPIDLVAMAEANRRRGMHTARQFGAQRFYPDFEALLDKESVKAVIVVLPNDVLPSDAGASSPYPPVISAALASGAHVWADAPAAGATGDVTKQYTDGAIKGRVYLMAGYRRPFMPGYEGLRALIDMARLKPSAYALWCTLPDQGDSGLDQGSDLAARLTHPLALLLDLFGEPKSMQWVWHPEQSGVALTLTYGTGLVGTVQCVLASATRPASETLQVQASGASLTVYEGCELVQSGAQVPLPADTERVLPVSALARRPFREAGVTTGLETSGYLGSLRLFCDSLLAAKPVPRMNIMHLLHLMSVQAALRSGRERQWVTP